MPGLLLMCFNRFMFVPAIDSMNIRQCQQENVTMHVGLQQP